MMMQGKLKRFEQTLPVAERLGIGYTKDGLVYRVAPGEVVKVHSGLDLEDKEIRARSEFDITSELYGAGIKVPEPKGVFYVDLTTRDRPVKGPGLVMEYVDGVDLKSLLLSSPKDYGKALAKYHEELEMVDSLGIELPDHDMFGSNALWMPKREEVRLIDFAGCRKVA